MAACLGSVLIEIQSDEAGWVVQAVGELLCSYDVATAIALETEKVLGGIAKDESDS